MKHLIVFCISLLCCSPSAFSANIGIANTSNFVNGDPGIESINAMAFGPESVLFIGDSKAAAIVAIDLSGHPAADNTKARINNLDGLIAQMLGASTDQVQITDIAVNPANGNIYIATHHSSSKPVLFRVDGDKLEHVALNSVLHSKTELTDAIAADATDKRGRDMRKWAISDIHYSNGKVMVSGLSNQEFASTFRSMDFPFGNSEVYGSIEIYHAAHGGYETHAPIKAFTTTILNGTPHMIASYTCTPLVVLPLNTIKDREHHKAKTVAELGNRNTPIDIIEMEKEGNRYILMANSARALMKIKVSDIEAFGDSLTEPVNENSGTAGVDFINLPLVNVQQLAKLNDKQFVMIQREANGNLALKLGGDRYL